jgi:hypothetical protein
MTTETETPPQFIKLMEMEKELLKDKSVIKFIKNYITIQEETQKISKTDHQDAIILNGILYINKIDNIHIKQFNNLNETKTHAYLEIFTKMVYTNEYTTDETALKVFSKQYTTHAYYKYRYPEYRREWNKIASLEETIVINVCAIDIVNNLKWDKYSGGFIFINDIYGMYYDIITQNNCNKSIMGFLTNDNIKSVHKDNECSICYEKIGYKLTCGHRCCIECQQKLTKRNCPICRKKIKEFTTDHHYCDGGYDSEGNEVIDVNE